MVALGFSLLRILVQMCVLSCLSLCKWRRARKKEGDGVGDRCFKCQPKLILLYDVADAFIEGLKRRGVERVELRPEKMTVNNGSF